MKLTRRPRCAIFDLDGVLLDTEPLYTKATARSPRASARSTTGRSSATASAAARWRRRASSWMRSALPLSPEALVDERERVLTELVARAPAIAGAEAFTRALAARGVPLAIATSTEAPLFAIKAAASPRLAGDLRRGGVRRRSARGAAQAGARHLPGGGRRTWARRRPSAWCSRTRPSASRRRAPPACR